MKYTPYPTMALNDRTWPQVRVDQAPRWCSVDLRDGNQALAQPMTLRQRFELFDLLVGLGFKEIEVAFPSSGSADFGFVRELIETGRVPDGVALQVIMPGKRELIDRTFESVAGARRVIMHLYFPTSRKHREVVFRQSRSELRESICAAVKHITDCTERLSETQVSFEFSPESFTGTETDFAIEVCQEVSSIWRPAPDRELIFNLPATVELSTPNIFADQIELFCRKTLENDHCVVGVHPHNDRGTAVAATELALMAGARRVEGTLFGAGERSGNVDLITLALNLFTQGVDPKLDLSDINAVVSVFERCIGIPVHPRHPYAGSQIFTAYSGSHQDAIRKGLKQFRDSVAPRWEVPYLPMDPRDVGRGFEDLVGITNQSGKGGAAFLVEMRLGADLPAWLARDFGIRLREVLDTLEATLPSDDVFALFKRAYVAHAPLLDLTAKATPHSVTVTEEEVVSYVAERSRQLGIGASVLDAEVARAEYPEQGSLVLFLRAELGGSDERITVGLGSSVALAVDAALSGLKPSFEAKPEFEEVRAPQAVL